MCIEHARPRCSLRNSRDIHDACHQGRAQAIRGARLGRLAAGPASSDREFAGERLRTVLQTARKELRLIALIAIRSARLSRPMPRPRFPAGTLPFRPYQTPSGANFGARRADPTASAPRFQTPLTRLRSLTGGCGFLPIARTYMHVNEMRRSARRNRPFGLSFIGYAKGK
jgi:hypothetical protein